VDDFTGDSNDGFDDHFRAEEEEYEYL